MKIQKRRLAALASLALVAGLGLTACGDDAEGNGEAGGNGDITFLPKNLGNPYFDASTAGGERAAEEFGGSIEEVGPDQATPDSQVSFINTAAQQGVGALVVSANDPSAICDALNEARDAGVKVVTFDSDTNPECRDVFVNQADAEGIAKKQVEIIAQQIGGSGEIAILSAAANATNQNAWIEMMEEELAANHPDIELVDIVYGDDDAAKSAEQAAGLLQAHPDLGAIIAPTTVGIREAAKYISGSEYKGDVAVTGLGLPSEMKAYIEDGTVEIFGLWNPEDLGYIAVHAAAQAAGEGLGDAFTAGEFDLEVGEDGVVIVGPPFEFTAENIDEFEF